MDVRRKENSDAEGASVSVLLLQVALLGPTSVTLAIESLHQCLATIGRVALAAQCQRFNLAVPVYATH